MDSRKRGKKYYFGKVCETHPELGGKRRANNGRCVVCINDYNKARFKELRRQRREEKAANASAGG
jgi:hypothetical protein